MLGQVVMSVGLVLMLALSLYLWRVPAGPACPRCGTLTRPRPLGPARGPRLLAVARAAAECPACGWRGHLRRQPPAPVRARSGRVSR